MIETGFDCDTDQALSHCSETCGDGRNMGFFQCDDGNNDDFDGCDSECKIEDGWICSGGTSFRRDTCKEICGDGVNFYQFDCDDGNSKNGDG